MCGRFIAKSDKAWEHFFTLKKPPPQFESWNIAPTQRVPVIRRTEEGNTCELLRWGLIPFFAHGVAPAYHTINARVETIATSPAWRGPWKRAQRCIVPANGFYEWQVQADGSKRPWFIHLKERDLFGFAGLWDRSVTEAGEAIESFTLITLPASPFMSQIHNTRLREPAILRVQDHEAWLAGPSEPARAALRSCEEGVLSAHAVSTRVNSPRNNGIELIAATE